MPDVLLSLLASIAAAAVLLLLGAGPVVRAVRDHTRRPRSALGRHEVRIVGLALFAGMVAAMVIALDAAADGGLLGQRNLVEQLLPLVVGAAFGGCLVILPWQPGRVARRLRTMADVVPVVTLLVVGATELATGGRVFDGLYAMLAVLLLGSLPLLTLARVLDGPGPGSGGRRSPAPG